MLLGALLRDGGEPDRRERRRTLEGCARPPSPPTCLWLSTNRCHDFSPKGFFVGRGNKIHSHASNTKHFDTKHLLLFEGRNPNPLVIGFWRVVAGFMEMICGEWGCARSVCVCACMRVRACVCFDDRPLPVPCTPQGGRRRVGLRQGPPRASGGRRMRWPHPTHTPTTHTTHVLDSDGMQGSVIPDPDSFFVWIFIG